MIISRSPLRISLGGGGTDLPSYYKDNEGFLIAAAIDKYVYVTITKPFEKGIYLKYSDIEKVSDANNIKHNIIRETLKLKQFFTNQIEITTLADIPSGTGLGSSGSFTTALIKSLSMFNYENISTKKLAELACKIEIDILKRPIGKQDQYASAYGGISYFNFAKDGSVKVNKLNLKEEILIELEENLLLFFTGFVRDANSILKDQNEKSISLDKTMIENLNKVKETGYESKKLLENGLLNDYGNLLNEHWLRKKLRSKKMSNKKIDQIYELGLKNGAIGGKVVGAGGGGFIMFLANDKTKLRKKMRELKLIETKFSFDFEGTKVLMT